MNINFIKRAIEHYLAFSEECHDNQNEVDRGLKALEEIACVMDRYDHVDTWDAEGVLISAMAWSDILNELTYDDMAYCKRTWGRTVKAAYYYDLVRKNHMYGIAEVPKCYLSYGYEILNDLWDDNEDEGSHNPLGSMDYVPDDKVQYVLNYFQHNDPNGEYDAKDMRENPLEYVEILKGWMDDMGSEVTMKDVRKYCMMLSILYTLASNN